MDSCDFLISLGILISVTRSQGYSIECGDSRRTVKTDDTCLTLSPLVPFSRTPGSIIRYSCAVLLAGLRESGIDFCPVEVCQDNGTWSTASLSCAVNECYPRGHPEAYMGRRKCTVNGHACEQWRNHGISGQEHGYCRDPGGEKGAPWCHVTTTSVPVTWEFCDVPICDDMRLDTQRCDDEYIESCTLPDMTVKVDHHCTGIKSLPVYSTDVGSTIHFRCSYIQANLRSSTDYCPVQVCQRGGQWTAASISCGENECYESGRSNEYHGHRSCTSSGRQCQAWNTQYPHTHDFENASFPGENMTGSYCRDPKRKRGAPWCFTIDPDTEWEDCSVDLCDEIELMSTECSSLSEQELGIGYPAPSDKYLSRSNAWGHYHPFGTGHYNQPVPTHHILNSNIQPVPTHHILNSNTQPVLTQHIQPVPTPHIQPVPTHYILNSNTQPVPTPHILNNNIQPVPTQHILNSNTQPVPTPHILNNNIQPVPTPHILNSNTQPVPTHHILNSNTQPVPTPHILNSNTQPVPTHHILNSNTQPVPTPHILNSNTQPVPTQHIQPVPTPHIQPVPTPHILNSNTQPVPTPHILNSNTQHVPSPHILNSNTQHVPSRHSNTEHVFTGQTFYSNIISTDKMIHHSPSHTSGNIHSPHFLGDHTQTSDVVDKDPPRHPYQSHGGPNQPFLSDLSEHTQPESGKASATDTPNLVSSVEKETKHHHPTSRDDMSASRDIVSSSWSGTQLDRKDDMKTWLPGQNRPYIVPGYKSSGNLDVDYTSYDPSFVPSQLVDELGLVSSSSNFMTTTSGLVATLEATTYTMSGGRYVMISGVFDIAKEATREADDKSSQLSSYSHGDQDVSLFSTQNSIIYHHVSNNKGSTDAFLHASLQALGETVYEKHIMLHSDMQTKSIRQVSAHASEETSHTPTLMWSRDYRGIMVTEVITAPQSEIGTAFTVTVQGDTGPDMPTRYEGGLMDRSRGYERLLTLNSVSYMPSGQDSLTTNHKVTKVPEDVQDSTTTTQDGQGTFFDSNQIQPSYLSIRSAMHTATSPLPVTEDNDLIPSPVKSTGTTDNVHNVDRSVYRMEEATPRTDVQTEGDDPVIDRRVKVSPTSSVTSLISPYLLSAMEDVLPPNGPDKDVLEHKTTENVSQRSSSSENTSSGDRSTTVISGNEDRDKLTSHKKIATNQCLVDINDMDGERGRLNTNVWAFRQAAINFTKLTPMSGNLQRIHENELSCSRHCSRVYKCDMFAFDLQLHICALFSFELGEFHLDCTEHGWLACYTKYVTF